jgi:transposase
LGSPGIHSTASHPYKRRHRIENAICRIKDLRRIATRYDELARNYLTAVYLAAAIVWRIL